jgi:hypothetical protein
LFELPRKDSSKGFPATSAALTGQQNAITVKAAINPVTMATVICDLRIN